jgi:hypothetical protein
MEEPNNIVVKISDYGKKFNHHQGGEIVFFTCSKQQGIDLKTAFSGLKLFSLFCYYYKPVGKLT